MLDYQTQTLSDEPFCQKKPAEKHCLNLPLGNFNLLTFLALERGGALQAKIQCFWMVHNCGVVLHHI